MCWPGLADVPTCWPRVGRPRGSAPSWLPEAPSVADLGWSDAPPRAVAPAGDEHNYHFLTDAEPVPQLPDEHEVFDVNAVRADFPILKETVNGKPLIWFDNAATTQKPQVVIDRLSYFYAHENSNIHRAAHELAARATDAYEEARDTVRRFIGAPRPKRSSSCAAPPRRSTWWRYAWGGKHLQPGDEIVITHLEHHANIVPWQLISQKTGAILKVAPVDDAGNLLLSEFEELLGPRTKLVAASPGVQRAGHGGAGREDRRVGSPLRRPGADRRRPVDSAYAGQCRRTRRRFLRLLRAQDLRPHRDRRAVRAPRRR